VGLALATGPARAEVVFPEPVVELGEVRTGGIIERACPFVNQGAAPIEVVEVKAGCSCLQAEAAEHLIAAGRSGTLRLRVNTLSASAGRHAWRVTLRYRAGGALCEQELLVRALVVSEIIVQPPELTVYAEGPTQHEVAVLDLRPAPLRIVRVEASAPHLHVGSVVETTDGTGRLVRRVRFTVVGDCPPGRHDDVLVLCTDDEQYRELRIPVTVIKRSRQRYTALPPSVTMVASAAQPTPSRIVTVRDSQNQPVLIDRVEADDPALSCQWSQGPHTTGTVRITADRNRLPPEGLTSRVRVFFRTDGADCLIIPVTCEVR
jgi:hypothetical protein